MSVHTTACPRNCYSTCTIRVEVENGKLRRVLPHEGNRATPEGACLKGLSYVERQVAADRILHPLRRTGNGGYERIGWDDALDLICSRLEPLRTRPRSVFFYAASGTKGLLNGASLAFWRLFGGCTTTYGDLCWPAGLEATRLTLGANRHSPPWDLAEARLIVLWGKNPAETNLHQMRFIHQARERGAKVVVVDPRRTETAEVADLLIQPRPGSDGALALAVAHLLFTEGRVDRDFLDAHVLGADDFRALAAEMPPERAARITGVPVATVQRLADWIGTVRPMTLAPGYGMQRYTNSGQTIRALLALVVLTGNLGRPGAGWAYANLTSHVFSSPGDPLELYPPAAGEGGGDPVRVSVSTARLGADLLRQRDPAIDFIWVERGNPLSQNPDTATVRTAFRRAGFRVVVEQFPTDTAREADLILPAKTFVEQTDVITAYWHPYIQLTPKLLDPPGEVRPETEIYRELAHRLGLDPSAVDEHIPGPDEAAVRAWLDRRLAPLGLDCERLREGPAIAPGGDEIAFADLVFPTPSGRIELMSAEAGQRWGADPLPRFRPPVESLLGDGPRRHPIHLLTPNTKNRIHSQFNNLPSIRELDERPRIHLSGPDAEARGIGPGQRVRVFNDRGEITLEAAVDLSLTAGTAWITNGWWASEGGAVNLLSLGRETDMGHGAAFHDNLVEVVRA